MRKEPEGNVAGVLVVEEEVLGHVKSPVDGGNDSANHERGDEGSNGGEEIEGAEGLKVAHEADRG